MIVSRGLVDPKTSLNRSWSKGKQVNIPVLSYVKLTFPANAGRVVALFKLIASRRTVMVRKDVICDDASGATRGTREKGACDPYQDPTLVPLV